MTNQNRNTTETKTKTKNRNKNKINKKTEKTKHTTTSIGNPTSMKIYNLSTYTLNAYERSLLEKGLSFCPTNNPDEFQLFIDLHAFIRKLTLKRHFSIINSNPQPTVPNNGEYPNPNTSTYPDLELKTSNSPQAPSSSTEPIIDNPTSAHSPPPIGSGLRAKSKFYPTYHKGHHIETFYSLVASELRKINSDSKRNKPTHGSNLTFKQRGALKNLMENKNIIIRNADKGGSVVIQDTKDYLKEAKNILYDTRYYEILTNDPSKSHFAEYTALIQSTYESHVITKKELEFLTPSNPVMPIYYHLPKVHKTLTNPPGRPIIAGIGSLTSSLSEYIDLFLQRYVTNLDSYLKDSATLITLLKPIVWQPDFWWASLDVTALYTNIKHDLGLNAIKHFLSNDQEMPTTQRTFILNSIQFILSHNVFNFDSQLFIQTRGTAMGTKFAPSYANLFMGHFEHNMIKQSAWKDNIIMYKRYIDDLFFIWKGSAEDFHCFVDFLNNNQWGLSFTSNISKTNLEYLDIELSVLDTQIITKTFFKSVDCNSFLNFQSSHYKKWLLNIPYGQFRRVRKNCSRDVDFEHQVKIMETRFQEKGYPKTVIADAIKRTRNLTQNDCLPKTTITTMPKKANIRQNTKTNQTYSLNFITTYNQSHSNIRDILTKHWPILMNDSHLKHILPIRPNCTFRRAITLKNLLAPSKIRKPTPTDKSQDKQLAKQSGSHRCNSTRCKNCKSMLPKVTDFTSTVTNQTFKIKTAIDCSSSFVIYLLECSCKLQYVGRTKMALRNRMNTHRHNVTKGFTKHSVSRHALTKHHCDFPEFNLIAIEQIPEDVKDRFGLLCRREMFWIFQLNTLTPLGLNESLEAI